MSNRLPNGTVLPYGLLANTERASRVAAFNRANNNFPLRAGIVVKSYPIEDKRNQGKFTTEYDVLVMEQDSNKAITPLLYRNCVALDGLGAIGDFFEKRLREQKSKKGKSIGKDFKDQDGAIVALLCLDGSSDKGIIIGGFQHPNRKTKIKGDKHVLAGEFNGISIDINDDGSANLSFKGATNNDGTPKDKSAGITTVDIEKDGSIQFKNAGVTQRMEKAGNYLLSTEGNSSLAVKKEFSLLVQDKANFEIAKDLGIKTDKLIFEAQGSADFKMEQLSMEAKSEMKLKGMMFTVEAGSMAKIKSSQITLDGLVFLGGPGGTPAPTLQTQYIGVGNLGAPVLSQAVGPFATKVFVK